MMRIVVESCVRPLRVSAFIVLLALTGCLRPSQDTSVAKGGVSVAARANAAPSISGTPVTDTPAGVAYVFTPAAADANGDALTFQIQNKPQWASFNIATGQLTGTPGDADVGNHANILISVSDGKASTNLGAFSIIVNRANNSGTALLLSWSVPTQNTDGSPLTDLAGFNVYYGKSPSDLSRRAQLPGSTSVQFWATNLDAGEWFFTVSAYNYAGVESAPSVTASTTVS